MSNEQELQMISEMRRLIYGNWQTCVTYAFAELGIADILQDQTLSAAELSTETGTNPHALLRFLRCCGQIGFVQIDVDKAGFYLTPFGRLLASDHPLSQRDAARLNGADYRYQPWGFLTDILKAGHSRGFSPTVERGSLDYLADKPDKLGVFQRAMTNLSVNEDQVIAEAWDFSNFKVVVDIGCGHGTLIKAILNANSHLAGIMFDLEEVLSEVDISEDCFNGRLTQQMGSFFDSVPKEGDVYVMKNVIHNWPEERAIALLENTRKAMSNDDRLLIVEYLIPEDNELSIVKWIDLNFFVLVDGADRTADEYTALAEKAGLKIVSFIATETGRHIIELAAN